MTGWTRLRYRGIVEIVEIIREAETEMMKERKIVGEAIAPRVVIEIDI